MLATVVGLILGSSALVTRQLLIVAGRVSAWLAATRSSAITNFGIADPRGSVGQVFERGAERGLGIMCMAFMNLGGILALFVPWFWILLPATVPLVVMAGASALMRQRHIGVAAFYRLRRQLLPYVVLTPIASVTIAVPMTFVAQTYLRLDFLWDTDLRLVPGLHSHLSDLREAFPDVFGWHVPRFVDIAEALAWSVLVGTLLTWVLPMVLKRDITGLVACAVACGAPFLGPNIETIGPWLDIPAPHFPPVMFVPCWAWSS